MASNTSDSDATKKSKSSTNENNYNNKNFNSKNKSRNHKNNSSMETNNKTPAGSYDKNKNGQPQDKSSSSSSSSDEGDFVFDKSHRMSHKNFPILDRCWKFRPPPRGFTSESYVLCQNFVDSCICNFGSNCVEAHGNDELREWKERFEIRKNKLEKSLKTQYGKSYTEDLLERLHQSTNPEKIMKERLDGVEVTCSNEMNLTVSSKTCKREWIFVLKTSKVLKAVALLLDEHRTHFSIKHVYPMLPGKQSTNQIDGCKTLATDQEWLANVECSSDSSESVGNESLVSHRVKICFSTDIYGKRRLNFREIS